MQGQVRCINALFLNHYMKEWVVGRVSCAKLEHCVDLHIHTIHSDGSNTPAEVVRMAAGMNLKALAITDHDTVQGLASGLEEADKVGITLIPGIELTVRYPVTLHILGYYIDAKNEQLLLQLKKEANMGMRALALALKYLSKAKEDARNLLLESCGKHLSVGVVLEYLRAHPDIDVHGDLTKRIGRVFEDYKAILPDPYEAISLIHKCGGVAFLAHPSKINCTGGEFLRLLEDLISAGLDGVEAIHPDHTAKDVEQLKQLAFKYHIMCSGGSDFHGEKKKGVRIGEGRGDLRVPVSMLKEIQYRCRRG